MRILMVVAVLLVSSVAAGKPGLVAVLPLSGPNSTMSPAGRQILEESIRATTETALADFTVLSAENTLAVLHDNGVDIRKACEASCLLETGREMKARYLVSSTAATLDGVHTVFVRLLDTQDGKVRTVKLVGREKDVVAEWDQKGPGLFTAVAAPASPAAAASARVAASSTGLTWSEPAKSRMNWADAISHCQRSDARLPTVSEWRRAMDGGHEFPGGLYWTSNTWKSSSGDEPQMLDSRGDVTDGHADHTTHVICVAGTPVVPAAAQPATGLTWSEPAKSERNWADATAYCASSGARLPTVAEWKSAVDGGREFTAGGYWTSDTEMRFGQKEPRMAFADGSVEEGNAGQEARVICVH